MTQVEMDELREVEWNFTAIKNFEKRAKEILGRSHVTVPNIVIIDGNPIETGTVPVANASHHMLLARFGRMAEILEVAVGAASGLSWMESKGQPSAAAKAIDGWMAHGNSLDDLAELMYSEYLRASNPLAFAEREKSLEKKNSETT